MTAYVALVRAVNVSGTGKLPKEDLTAIGEACGFEGCRTFINSGKLLKDIRYFFYFSTVFLLFVGAGESTTNHSHIPDCNEVRAQLK